jgi:hypothetical protein
MENFKAYYLRQTFMEMLWEMEMNYCNMSVKEYWIYYNKLKGINDTDAA